MAARAPKPSQTPRRPPPQHVGRVRWLVLLLIVLGLGALAFLVPIGGRTLVDQLRNRTDPPSPSAVTPAVTQRPATQGPAPAPTPVKAPPSPTTPETREEIWPEDKRELEKLLR